MHRFNGFPPAALDFLAELAVHNDRDWFQARRADYEQALLEPARQLVVELGSELQARVAPGIQADPRVGGSILRLARDTRFAADKTPYKQHLELVFWEGEPPSRGRPCYFLRLEAERVLVAAGMRRMEGDLLARYRKAVLDHRSGDALADAIAAATHSRGARLAEPERKRVPRGCDPGHPRAALLRHAGLVALIEEPLPRSVGSAAFESWVATRMERLAPLERWMTKTLFA